MQNINNTNEFHKYKSTTSSDGNNSGNVSGNRPSVAGWVVIIVVGFFFLYFLFSGASWDAIDTLLGLGLIVYLFFNSAFK